MVANKKATVLLLIVALSATVSLLVGSGKEDILIVAYHAYTLVDSVIIVSIGAVGNNTPGIDPSLIGYGYLHVYAEHTDKKKSWNTRRSHDLVNAKTFHTLPGVKEGLIDSSFVICYRIQH